MHRLWLVVLVVAACHTSLDPPAEVIHARFDPDEKVIPMPTNVLRDAELGRLDVPLDGDLSDAEREFYAFLNTMDGWSTTMPATVELTGPIAPQTVNDATLQVWHWRDTPRRVTDARVSISDTETEIKIDAPRTGWERGETYVVVLRGGAAGVEGKRGELVECDAAFYFLRQTERLDTPEHERAFPGNTRAERQNNARDLEKIRAELLPYFDFFEARDIPRSEVASLWVFTVTERVELAMDKASQRMPLPINLLIDPDSGMIDIPPAEWDSPTVLSAKTRLQEYDGFGISSRMMFGFTDAIDPDTINAQTVALYDLAGAEPRLVPAELTVLPDGRNVEIEPIGRPLSEASDYAIALSDQIRDIDGQPIALMPIGHFLRSRSPIHTDDGSQIGAVAGDDARLVETVRAQVAPVLADLGRDGLLSVWTFSTQSVTAPMQSWIKKPEQLGVSPHPTDVHHLSPGEALLDFPLAIASLLWVGDVYDGQIETPVFLDPQTRAWRGDGGHDVQNIRFTMSVPRNPDGPVPVVIFGHGVMTERRFVLAIGDALAARGFAAIAIDLPFHGERSYCWFEGPLTIPDPQTGELTPLTQPCEDGTTCQADGRCVDSAGQGNHLRKWPILGMYMSSGAAFLEVEHIANTADHMRQGVIDMAALSRSLLQGDWESVVGVELDTGRLYFAGQSLGGIIGATFVAVSPDIERAVLNVAGADTVDLFDDSAVFGAQVDAFFEREDVARESYDGHRFLNVAKLLMDSTDPHGFSGLLAARDVMVQMATLDFIVPNDYTRRLADLADLPRRDYIAEHAFLALPIEPEYLRGTSELARFLTGDFQP